MKSNLELWAEDEERPFSLEVMIERWNDSNSDDNKHGFFHAMALGLIWTSSPYKFEAANDLELLAGISLWRHFDHKIAEIDRKYA